jgi:hypothetical protein
LTAAPELLAFLRRRSPSAQGVGCQLCLFTLKDLEKNGELTKKTPDFLVSSDGSMPFPADSKFRHLELENAPGRDSVKPVPQKK